MKKQDWKVLKNIFNPRNVNGICSVETPNKDADGNLTNDPDLAVDWIRVTNPSDIEDENENEIENNLSNGFNTSTTTSSTTYGTSMSAYELTGVTEGDSTASRTTDAQLDLVVL